MHVIIQKVGKENRANPGGQRLGTTVRHTHRIYYDI